MRGLEHASLAVARPVAAGDVEWPYSTVMRGGETRAGAVVSTTEIVWTPAEAFPHASTAVHVRRIVPVLPHPPGTH
jgi:hypothetical protein